MSQHSEIQQRAKFDQVRYANCWEDADILVEALQPAGRFCVSIGSAGDNSFSLLAEGAAQVIAVELNPTQVACIELRKAAYSELTYDEFLILLGERDGERLPLFERCSSHLTQDSLAFWSSRMEEIETGFYRHGKFENYFKLFRNRIIPLIHSRKRVAALLQEKSLPERKAFYDKVWNSWRWRLLFNLFFSRTVMGRLGRDPSFFDYVEGSVADRILGRTKHALTELSPHDNPYLRWILNGCYGESLPHALREENFETIKANIDKFTIESRPLESLLTNGQEKFDAFNLSDIFEYMSEQNFRALLEQICSASNPGARLAYWNMLAPRSRPEDMADKLQSLPELSEQLHLQDKAFFYSRFIVEEVL
ncbi:S-adenosylmethionine-diacylglycerol 3-amino-3-carboxypropyl transferase [Rubritalea squalenifaciens DSM 18772]|uniref:S-adenosylmethionine-diacylglycerol 3-amino-3-carboxypropyl transferase n=1 Tax=Rubritalea squalenifaciens DSM 18772 TaxID=1123071 RepID=A0A1M6HUW9_9BACT|nr:DUF3419 family protein [Rubritalea squalenifaciens]SHJ25993.1 S-adenosylmethionine-diacylglycerol 3-amino-3-carboxypropyl transferase [Rubritalea squalenifaciens DSM 18772]